jgi:acetyl esterase/lipase
VPSPAHRFVAGVIRRTRRVPTVTDPDAKAAELVALNRTRRTEPPAWVAKDWEVETRDVGFPVFVLTPRSGSWSTTLVHLHGGSFTAPAHDLQWRFAARIAAAVGARLVVPAYPLAPEHTWRDSHDTLVDLVGKLAGEGPVVLQGDSAGGGMALAIALGLRERGGPQVERMVLVSPWLDLTTSAPGTAEAGRRDPWLNVDNVPVYARFWAGSRRDLFRPQVSPALADLSGLPPTLMICGTHDVLFPACDVVASRAPAYGWDLRFWVGEGLIHVYPLLPVPEAKVARERIVEFLGG